MRPAPGYLSDYERGAWNSPPTPADGDYDKLCVEEGEAEDGPLLRSGSHRSSGSTFDPVTEMGTRVTAEWLVGSWVSTESCATSADVTFRSDGAYERPADRGRWRLAGAGVQLSIEDEARRDEDGMPDGYLPLGKPRSASQSVVRTGIDGIRLAGDAMIRC